MLKKIQNASIIMAMLFSAQSFSLSAYADPAQKIAVIDTNKISEKSLVYQNLKKQVEEKNNQCKQKALKIQEKLQKKFQELETQKSALSKDAQESQNYALIQEAEMSQKAVYEERARLDKAANDALAIVETKVTEILTKYSEANGISIVLAKMHALYSQPSMEITDVVLEELNKSITDVKIDFEITPNVSDTAPAVKDTKKLKGKS